MLRRKLKSAPVPANPGNTASKRRRPSPAWTATAIGVLCLSTAMTTSADALPVSAAQGQARTGAYAKVSHRPIIFVHGWHSGGAVWNGMLGYAETQGYRSNELHVYDYSGKTKPGEHNPGIGEIAGDLSRRVDEIARTSPDGKVDIVAHSMGGLVARAYIKMLGGVDKVQHFVSMGSPHHGTIVADVGVGGSDAVNKIGFFLGENNVLVGHARELAKNCDAQCRDMASGSYFLKSLNSGTEAPRRADGYPRYTTFRSNVDDEPAVHKNTRDGLAPKVGLCDGVVFGITEQGSWALEGNGPNVRGGKTSALKGADNIVTTCLSHDGFLNDPWTQEKALDALAETAGGETDKYVPRARNTTTCNALTRTHLGGNYVQAWLQSCLQVSPAKEVTPVLRIRGCGHYRKPWFLGGQRVWYYAPEGWGDNVQCVMTRHDLLLKKETRSRWEPGGHEATFTTRAGEVKVGSLSLQGSGTYRLHSSTLSSPHGSPRISVNVRPWNDDDNYTTLNPWVEGPSVTVR